MNDEREQGERAVVKAPEDAKVELNELHHHSLKIARYLLQEMNRDLETAEDLRQTALLKYLQLDEERRNEIRHPRAYLYRIMRNEILDQIRTEKSYVLSSLDALEDKDREPKLADHSANIDLRPLLRKVWSQVEGEDRRLFELLTFGNTGAEIALRLNISEDAARQRVSRLKAKIKAILAENQVSS